MKITFIRLWACIILCLACPIYAQKDTVKQGQDLRHYISASPLAILSGLVRADYEYIFKDKRYAIVATALLGSTQHTRSGHAFTRSSSGLEIGNKLYSLKINESEPGEANFYLNLGLRYQYFALKYEDEVWRSHMDDSTGLPLYRLSKANIYPKAHRFSFVPQTGFVLKYNRFMCDFYFGLSLYKEIIKGNENNVELPLNGWSNFGLHHTTIFTGLKLGVLF